MVNIEYTGVNGKTTRFGSASADDAMKRLRDISGYNGNVMDSAAAGLAGAFAARHRNASRIKNESGTKRTRFGGVSASGVFSSKEGTVARLPTLAGIRIENGRLVATKQDKFVSETGSVVATGDRKHESVAEIPTYEGVRAKAESVAESAAKKYVSEAQKSSLRTIEVVTDIRFDASGPLKIVVEKTPITVSGTGASNVQNWSIGEEVMVHESMSMERHSYVYVISRRANVSSTEAKTQN